MLDRQRRVIEALEEALMEYAAKYGVTDKARAAMVLSSKIEADRIRENVQPE